MIRFAKSRFLTRLRPAMPAEESRRVARVVATARALLSACSLLAIYLDPTEPSRFAEVAYSLMVVYALYGIAIMLVFRRMADARPVPPLLLHSIDLLWVACITLFTEGPNSPVLPVLYFCAAGGGVPLGADGDVGYGGRSRDAALHRSAVSMARPHGNRAIDGRRV